ncbi:hypothetical protein OAT16_09975, partial [Prolixibacteraceae bacterium]|nr:hypothetical protein [Prolixibacteraceae bacterium]
PLKGNQRLDLTMPFRFQDNSGSWHLDGYYEFTGRLADQFGVFVGPGVGMGVSWHDGGSFDGDDHGFFINFGAIAGVTYTNPSFPFDIEFSMRPTVVVINDYDGAFNLDFTLGFLYRF